MKFEKVKKKYALNNSYFKNRRLQDPSDPFEVLDYVRQHDELPYNEELNDNWFYDCFVEYQKRAGVINSQFFHTLQTAKHLATMVGGCVLGSETRILDACCGFGMITKELRSFGRGLNIVAFDLDKRLTEACEYFRPDIMVYAEDFKNKENPKGVQGWKYDIVVSNPPYEVKELTEFLYFVDDILYNDGVVILLIPIGFLDKTRPKRLVEVLNKFKIINHEPMQEDFARTRVKAEIVKLKKKGLNSKTKQKD